MDVFAKEFVDLSSAELYSILQARLEVFVVEQEILYNDCDGLDEQAMHVWLADEQGILAYCRILQKQDPQPRIFIGRVLTVSRIRRQGFGKKLMLQAMRVVREKYQADQVFVEAQSYVRKFYEDLGFYQISEPFDDVGIEHIEMVCSL